MKEVLGCALGLVALLALRSFLQDRYETTMTAVATGRASHCLSLVGSTTREEDRSTYIVGSIRNHCDREIGHVTVVFKVAGSSDSKFNHRDAILYAYENNVKPGETRAFKTMFPAGRNDTFRFDTINAY
jgi:hypothetical protein